MPAKTYVTPSSLDPMAAAEYAPSMELPHLKDDPHLKLVRPLVEAYQAFWLADSRHIRSMRLTTSQFDVIVTLGDTDGMTCSEQLKKIRMRAVALRRDQATCWEKQLRPGLAEHGVRILEPEDYSERVRQFLTLYFRAEIYPLLTPLASCITDEHPQRHSAMVSADALDMVLYEINLIETARRVE